MSGLVHWQTIISLSYIGVGACFEHQLVLHIGIGYNLSMLPKRGGGLGFKTKRRYIVLL